MTENNLQFDLEENIMSCWGVTSELNLLLEELMENDNFTRDDASNFVLGLHRIYESKFDKTYRTFEAFIREYYRMRDEVKYLKGDLEHMRAELRDYQDREYSGLGEWREYSNDEIDEGVFMEDENGYFIFPK